MRHRLLIGACVLCVLSGGVALWYVQAIYAHVEAWEHKLRLPVLRTQAFDGDGFMQTLNDQWISKGVTKTVTTTRNLNETDDQFLARHNSLVAAQLALFPPD